MATSEMKDKIAAADAKFMDSFNAADFVALSNVYTEDCRLMPSGVPLLLGREAVAKVFKSVYDSGSKKVKLEREEIGPAGGDVIYSRGRYTFYLADGSISDEGKFVVLWKLIDDKVLMYTDIFNTSKST